MSDTLDTLALQLGTIHQSMAETEQAITKAVATQQATLKQLQEQDKQIREAIRQAMDEQHISKWENDIVSLTNIAPTTRTGVDTKRLKAEQPEIFEQYKKETPVKGSLRIKIKETK